ncbi:MAG: 4-(cytidine 5'-diphospho)-2-C-methyl-D-erythritol kinase [Pseudomonadota bacterium]
MRAEPLVLPAPAKLNLFLRITGRRADGYHALQTLYQLLDFGDEVRLEPLENDTIERSVAIPGVDEASDLSLRAAHLLQQTAQAQGRPMGGARIGVSKAIPQGSGLGGASTDAASVLLGLNALWQCGFDRRQLAELGLRLGADVPVFVHGYSAWAEGVGERLQPVALGKRWYVLLFPDEGASTAELFADPTLRRDGVPVAPPAATEAERGWSQGYEATQGPPAGARDWCALGNDFAPVLLKRSSAVADAWRFLENFGTPRLTGTGSTLFLEASDESVASRLTSTLKNHYNVRAVGGLDRSPALESLDRGPAAA